MAACHSSKVNEGVRISYAGLMNTSEQGRLGEVAVIKALVLDGYDVFVPVGGNTPCDLIALKDNRTWRVEVKATRKNVRGAYDIAVASVRYNNTRSVRKPFDSSNSDMLAFYLIDDDEVRFLDSHLLHGRTSYTIRT